jgi:hypothetical protein
MVDFSSHCTHSTAALSTVFIDYPPDCVRMCPLKITNLKQSNCAQCHHYGVYKVHCCDAKRLRLRLPLLSVATYAFRCQSVQ